MSLFAELKKVYLTGHGPLPLLEKTYPRHGQRYNKNNTNSNNKKSAKTCNKKLLRVIDSSSGNIEKFIILRWALREKLFSFN